MKYDTIREAAQAWVSSFNAIPYSVVEKLYRISDGEDLWEITPPTVGDRVTLYNDWSTGEISEVVTEDGDTEYVVALDAGGSCRYARDDFEVERESVLPMWGTLWAFDEGIDDEWLDGEVLGSHVQEMADCGFRIYESEDYGHIFGIDGAGYDFYSEHWIPLYKVRGLQWHEKEDVA